MRERQDQDDKMYRTFAEFEREELRRMEASSSVNELIDGMFDEALDFDLQRGAQRQAMWDDADDEE